MFISHGNKEANLLPVDSVVSIVDLSVGVGGGLHAGVINLAHGSHELSGSKTDNLGLGGLGEGAGDKLGHASLCMS